MKKEKKTGKEKKRKENRRRLHALTTARNDAWQKVSLFFPGLPHRAPGFSHPQARAAHRHGFGVGARE